MTCWCRLSTPSLQAMRRARHRAGSRGPIIAAINALPGRRDGAWDGLRYSCPGRFGVASRRWNVGAESGLAQRLPHITQTHRLTRDPRSCVPYRVQSANVTEELDHPG